MDIGSLPDCFFTFQVYTLVYLKREKQQKPIKISSIYTNTFMNTLKNCSFYRILIGNEL